VSLRAAPTFPNFSRGCAMRDGAVSTIRGGGSFAGTKRILTSSHRGSKATTSGLASRSQAVTSTCSRR
jgi:hypothetical protein